MVYAILRKLTRKPTTKQYVTSERAIKKAVDASMKDQRDMVKRAKTIRDTAPAH